MLMYINKSSMDAKVLKIYTIAIMKYCHPMFILHNFKALRNVGRVVVVAKVFTFYSGPDNAIKATVLSCKVYGFGNQVFPH